MRVVTNVYMIYLCFWTARFYTMGEGKGAYITKWMAVFEYRPEQCVE